jgi:hypothetical protein
MEEEEEKIYCTHKVEDTGMGIQKGKTQPYFLKPIKPAESSYSPQIRRGSAWGLAIVKNLLEKHSRGAGGIRAKRAKELSLKRIHDILRRPSLAACHLKKKPTFRLGGENLQLTNLNVLYVEDVIHQSIYSE